MDHFKGFAALSKVGLFGPHLDPCRGRLRGGVDGDFTTNSFSQSVRQINVTSNVKHPTTNFGRPGGHHAIHPYWVLWGPPFIIKFLSRLGPGHSPKQTSAKMFSPFHVEAHSLIGNPCFLLSPVFFFTSLGQPSVPNYKPQIHGRYPHIICWHLAP